MKKEILLAVIIGLSLGLVITYGAYRARKSEEEKAAQTTDSIASSDISETDADSGMLTLFSPEDETIQDSEDIKITGNTYPSAFVVVFVNNDEIITNSDSSGNFSVETKLEEGANVISVHALNDKGESVIGERTVIYSTADLSNNDQNNESEEASESGDKT